MSKTSKRQIERVHAKDNLMFMLHQKLSEEYLQLSQSHLKVRKLSSDGMNLVNMKYSPIVLSLSQ